MPHNVLGGDRKTGPHLVLRIYGGSYHLTTDGKGKDEAGDRYSKKAAGGEERPPLIMKRGR